VNIAPGLVFSVMLLFQAHCYALLGPQPPCGKQPVPPYPGLGDSADVKSWSTPDLGRDWKPPTCTGWAASGFTTLVTTVARFRYISEAEGLMSQIGAISKLAGVRYWSTTHQRWQTLIVDTHALAGSQPASQRRGDFTSAEMTQGKVLYFEQVDNLSGKGIYRMHIAESSANRLVFDVEMSAGCAISAYRWLTRESCSRSTSWIVNRTMSGATTASCARDGK
jgi:hypothetical protein